MEASNLRRGEIRWPLNGFGRIAFSREQFCLGIAHSRLWNRRAGLATSIRKTRKRARNSVLSQPNLE